MVEEHRGAGRGELGGAELIDFQPVAYCTFN